MVAVGLLLVSALVTAVLFARAYVVLGYLSLTEIEHVIVVSAKSTPITFYQALTLSLVGITAIYAAFGVWFVGRRIKMSRRLLPLLIDETRVDGIVSRADVYSTKRGNMAYSRLDLNVVDSFGGCYAAAHEEPVGTDLPAVRPNMPASVWVGPTGRLVIGAAGGLFEGGSV